jgi:integrase
VLALDPGRLDGVRAKGRDGKGEKDRVVPFPERCLEPIRQQIERTRELHQSDLAAGYGSVWLPYAIAEKYPAAAREFLWQFVFPAGGISTDPQSGACRRHHLHENSVQKLVRAAVLRASIDKKIGCSCQTGLNRREAGWGAVTRRTDVLPVVF